FYRLAPVRPVAWRRAVPLSRATAHTDSAQVIGMTWTEKRPVYVQPAAMNAPAIEAKKNNTAAAGRSRSVGTPATLSTATAAPAKTGKAYGSNRGGSFTVRTIATLWTSRRSDSATGAPGCQIATT